MKNSSLSRVRTLTKVASIAKDYVQGWEYWLKNKDLFGNLRCFCLFIGYPRSGHSLLGSIINAHRHAVISHELDVVLYLKLRFKKEQILGLILQRDRKFEAIGRDWTGYSYAIPNQYQGRVQDLLVIGDKKGGSTTIRLRSKPELLERLNRELQLPLKFVHVVRDPFDNISTIAMRNNKGLEYALERYFRDTAANSELLSRLDKTSVLTVSHEGLIHNASDSIRTLCDFLGLDSPQSFLKDCSSIINEKPRRSRDLIHWSTQDRKRVNDCINRHDFLSYYTEQEWI